MPSRSSTRHDREIYGRDAAGELPSDHNERPNDQWSWTPIQPDQPDRIVDDERLLFWGIADNGEYMESGAKPVGAVASGRTSSIFTFTHERRVFEYLPNEIAYEGGRPVRNGFTVSDKTSADYSSAATGRVDVPGEIPGFANGVKFQAAVGATVTAYDSSWNTKANRQYILSSRLKLTSGVEPLLINEPDITGPESHCAFVVGGRSSTATVAVKKVNLGNGWWDVHVAFDTTLDFGSGVNNGVARYATSLAEGTDELFVQVYQIEDVTHRRDKVTPSEYIPTTEGTVVRTYTVDEVGRKLDVWAVSAAAMTNANSESRGFDDPAKWGVAGDVFVELVEGIDGQRLAAVLTDDDPAGQTHLNRSVAGLGTSSKVVSGVFYLKKADAPPSVAPDPNGLPAFLLQVSGGTSEILRVNPYTGEGIPHLTLPPEDWSVVDVGDWWAVVLTTPDSVADAVTLRIYPAHSTNPPGGGGSGSAVGSIVVDNVMCISGVNLAHHLVVSQVMTPIFTAGAPVTRTAEALSFDGALGDLILSRGAALTEMKHLIPVGENPSGAAISATILGTNTVGRWLFCNYNQANDNILSNDGSSAFSANLVQAQARIGATWFDTMRQIRTPDDVTENANFDGAMDSTASHFIMQRTNATVPVGYARNVRYYKPATYEEGKDILKGYVETGVIPAPVYGDPLQDPRVAFLGLYNNGEYMDNQPRGAGTLVEVRPSSMHTFTHEGRVFEYLPNEVAYEGGRPVRNGYTVSDKTMADYTNVTGKADAPGELPGFVNGIKFLANQGTTISAYDDSLSIEQNRQYIVSVRCKLSSGVEPFLRGEDGRGNATSHFAIAVAGRTTTVITSIKKVNLGDGVWDFHVAADTSLDYGAVLSGAIRYADNLLEDTDELFVQVYQIEDVTHRKDKATPSEYIPTVGATAVRTFTKDLNGQPLPNVWAVSVPATTNLRTSRDPKVGFNVDLIGAVTPTEGIDGSNEAHIWEDNDAGAFQYISYYAPVTPISGFHSAVFYVKKGPLSPGNFAPLFRVVASPSGSTNSPTGRIDYGFNPETGELVEKQILAGTFEGTVLDLGDWWAIVVTVVGEVAAAYLSVQVYPAVFVWPTGNYNVAAVGQITVDQICMYENTTHAMAVAAAKYPIFTAGAAVTRTKCQIEFDAANHPVASGVWFHEGDTPVDPTEWSTTGRYVLSASGGTGSAMAGRNGRRLIANYENTEAGNSTLTLAGGILHEENTPYRFGSVHDQATNKIKLQDQSLAVATAENFADFSIPAALAVQRTFTDYQRMRNIHAYDVPYAEGELILSRLVKGLLPEG